MVYALPVQKDDPLRFLIIDDNNSRLKTLTVTARSIWEHLEAFENARRSKSAGRDDRSLTVTERKEREIREGTTERESLRRLQADLAPESWGVRRIAYIVPNGEMHFIPWGALEIPYPVAVIPTWSWLLRPPLKKEFAKKACVIGDPNFGGLLPQLTGARSEASLIAERYGVRPLTGDQATEANLSRSVGEGVKILHFATHALYDVHLPLQSALILSDGHQPLTAERIYEKPLPAQLVVLSACETGMGKVVAGNDLLGLLRSFYLGGTRQTLSSLWPVEDEATRLFMETFYENISSGSPGPAWLAARDRLKNRGYSPSVYGAFILGGYLGEGGHTAGNVKGR